MINLGGSRKPKFQLTFTSDNEAVLTPSDYTRRRRRQNYHREDLPLPLVTPKTTPTVDYLCRGVPRPSARPEEVTGHGTVMSLPSEDKSVPNAHQFVCRTLDVGSDDGGLALPLQKVPTVPPWHPPLPPMCPLVLYS